MAVVKAEAYGHGGGVTARTLQRAGVRAFAVACLAEGCLLYTSTDSLQALMKADYMLALNSGHNIRRCIICGKYFMLKDVYKRQSAELIQATSLLKVSPISDR